MAMAQDFYAAFGLGEDDKHITTIDAGGVALVAIQSLYRMNREQQSEIEQLRTMVELLQQRLGVEVSEVRK